MRILLDTHTLIWHDKGSGRVSETAKRLVADESIEAFISIVSLWEIAIKRSLGKLETSKSPLEYWTIYRNTGIKLLPVYITHTTALELLPFHHRDPFDRMLIAQAQTENLTLLTVDEIFSQYDVRTMW